VGGMSLMGLLVLLMRRIGKWRLKSERFDVY
jgi:hypothetical protein